jgi:hypothetical protein
MEAVASQDAAEMHHCKVRLGRVGRVVVAQTRELERRHGQVAV